MSEPPSDAERERPPGLADGGVRGVLLLALALQLLVWWTIEGYSLADTIEYVDLAEHFVRDGVVEPAPGRMRPPAFPLLFAPLFALQWALGIEDVRPPMLIARVLQLAIGLAFVLATVRLGARLGGRRAGLLAGFLAATNPVFLRFCVDPLPGLLGGALVALGFERLLVPPGDAPRPALRAAAGGLLVGGAAIVSYKVLPIAAVLAALLVARDRWRGRVAWAAYAGGVAATLALAVALDRWMYGEWGLSLANYLVYNVTVAGVPLLLRLGLDGAATSLFEWAGRYYGHDRQVEPAALGERVARHEPETWYLAHLDELLVLPVLVLAAFALWRCLRRPRWPTSIVLVVLAAFLVVLSAKHSKSFRLFLPAVPLIAATCALGWEGALGLVPAAARRPLGAALLVATLVLGLVELHRAHPRIYGNHWQAVAWIDAESEGAARPQRFSSDYYFTVKYRGSPNLEHVRLGFAPTMWPREGAEPAGEDESLRLRVVRELRTLDWLLVTEDVLLSRPRLLRAVNGTFDLAGAFLEPGHSLAWGPVHVFRRRAERAAPGRRLFVLDAGAEDRAGLRGEVLTFADGEAELTWHGFRLEPLPGSGLGWLVFGTTSRTGLERRVLLEVRGAEAGGGGAELFRFSTRPAHGVLPTELWSPGTAVVEGRVVVVPREALRDPPAARLFVSAIAVDAETGAASRLSEKGSGASAPLDAGPLDLRGFAMSLAAAESVR